MTHPDGQIALFNDACFNVPKTETILNYHERLLGEIKFEPTKIHVLKSSGI